MEVKQTVEKKPCCLVSERKQKNATLFDLEAYL